MTPKNGQSTTLPPKRSEAIINPPLPSIKAHYSLKFPVLHLHSLPPSVLKSAIHSLSMLPEHSPKVPFQQPDETEDKKITHRNVQECLQTVAPVEQEDIRGDRPEEEQQEDFLKWTVLKNCPTDPHYLLHSQNPAECPAVNTLSGLTCGVPQKGLSQNKHKIRVDFKVCYVIIQLNKKFHFNQSVFSRPCQQRNLSAILSLCLSGGLCCAERVADGWPQCPYICLHHPAACLSALR